MDYKLYEFLRAAFLFYDDDEDGVITSMELGRIMRELGQRLNENDLRKLFRVADADADDVIGFDEFMMLMTAYMKHSDQTQDIHEAFHVIDKDGDGFITADELRMLMINLGEKLTDVEISEMIQEADTDGDGRISFEEFFAIMTVK